MKYNIFKADKITIDDEKMRVFKAWASVEVPDKQGEIVSIEDLKKLMPILMDRGGLIMDRHTNRPVGKILNYEIAEKDGKPGVMITAKIFDHYQLDDEVWNAIKSGEIKGLSIGGRGIKGASMINEKDGSEIKRLNLSELYEISVTPNPANPEATIEAVSIAKGDDVPTTITLKLKQEELNEISKNGRPPKEWWDRCIAAVSGKTDTPEQLCGWVYYNVLGGERSRAKEAVPVQKPFGAWKNFEDCVNDMKSKGYDEESAKRICGSLQAKFEKKEAFLDFILANFKTEEKSMDEKKEPEKVEPKVQPPKEAEQKKDDSGGIQALSEAISAMGAKLDKIIELLTSEYEAEKKSAQSGSVDKTEPENIKKEIENMRKELKEEIVKELGITPVPSPRPTQPEQPNPPNQPSNDLNNLALKIARGEVKLTMADIENMHKEQKAKIIRQFLDSQKGVI